MPASGEQAGLYIETAALRRDHFDPELLRRAAPVSGPISGPAVATTSE
jgi:hypothetical protein